jgi:hypothetical protein
LHITLLWNGCRLLTHPEPWGFKSENQTAVSVGGKVKGAVREFLKRNLSPQVFWFVRYRWWLTTFYLPRLLVSPFVRSNPKVDGFPVGSPTEFVNQIRVINVFAPTEMCRVMSRYGSDKGRDLHNYTMVYSALFGDRRDKALRIFELGLGTNNPRLASSMGKFGRPGASLRGWRELFPKAVVFGADIDRDILFEEDRIHTFYCNQLDIASINDLWSQPAMQPPMDIIIDDGLHTFEGNISFLNGSLGHLCPDGIYVVEDIQEEAIEKWHSYLEMACPTKFRNYEFAFVELTHKVSSANNLLLVRRRRA